VRAAIRWPVKSLVQGGSEARVMTSIPPPSREAVMTLLEAVACSRRGEPDEAARELIASARVVEVLPTMATDLYHFAHAAIKLGLEQHIDHEGLLKVIDVLKEGDFHLTGPDRLVAGDWVGDLYTDGGEGASARPSANIAESPADRPFAAVDLDHLTRDQLLRMGAAFLNEGTRAYEQRRLSDALSSFRQAFRIATHLEYAEGIATSLFWIGFAIHSGGNGSFAEQHYRDALDAVAGTTAAKRAALGPYVFRAASMFELEGNSTAATAYFRQAQELFQTSGDAEGLRLVREKLAVK
jgi:hypothetical protein